jgi:hypothetical protein
LASQFILGGAADTLEIPVVEKPGPADGRIEWVAVTVDAVVAQPVAKLPRRQLERGGGFVEAVDRDRH